MPKLHLAIMHEPYLQRIVVGEKTIESRFMMTRVAPYDRVATGDALLFKRAGGRVVARARVARVAQFADLTPEHVVDLIHTFRDELRLEKDFITKVCQRRYAVLIWLTTVQTVVPPQSYHHRDRRGWLVLGDEAGIKSKRGQESSTDFTD